MADVEQREASVAERVELQADGHFSPAAESHDWSLDGWPMARARVCSAAALAGSSQADSSPDGSGPARDGCLAGLQVDGSSRDESAWLPDDWPVARAQVCLVVELDDWSQDDSSQDEPELLPDDWRVDWVPADLARLDAR